MTGSANAGDTTGTPLVGRAAVVAALRGAVDTMVAGSGSSVLLAGEPGIGKTAVAMRAADYAERRGARVLWATCWDGDGAPGFWPWTQILRPLLAAVDPTDHPRRADLAAVLPEWSVDEPSPLAATERFRVFDAVASVLAEAVAVAPLLVVLDDLQWADAGSVRMLDFVERQSQQVGLMLLGTYRDTEVDAAEHPLRHLLAGRTGSVSVIGLTGLSLADTRELLERTSHDPVSVEVAAVVCRRTAGNPFLIRQVAGLPVAEWSGRGVPAGTEEVVLHRLARLPNTTADLLGIAAVVGTTFHESLLAQVADSVDITSTLEFAVRARIVEPLGGGTYRFHHDLFRETAYNQLGPAERMRLHGRIAAELDAVVEVGTRSRLAELSHHYGRSLPAGDAEKACHYAVLAAEDAVTRLAFEEAVRHWSRAVVAAGVPAPTALLVALADARRMAGEAAMARAGYVEAAASAARQGDRDGLARAALGLHVVGTGVGYSHHDTVSLLRAALVEVGAERSAMTARLLAALARELADGPERDVEQASALAERAVSIARQGGDPSALALALFALHDVIWAPGTATRRLELAAEMMSAADAGGEAELRWEARFARFVALVELGDPRAEEVLVELELFAEESRQPRFRYRALSRRAALTVLHGRYDEAARLIDEAAALAETIGEPDGFGVYATQWLVLAMTREGWSGVAAMERRYGAGIVPPEFTPELRAFLHLAAGERTAAASVLRDLPIGMDRSMFRWRALASAAFDVEVGAQTGDARICARAAEALRPHVDEFVVIGGAVVVVGPVPLYLGMAARVQGRWDEAVDWLEDAIAQSQAMSARPATARAEYELAVALLSRGEPGDSDRAHALLVAAAETADELGVEPVRDAATQLLSTEAGALGDTDEFRLDGEVWSLRYAGRTVRLRDTKGLRDLAVLLGSPGREISATRLLAGSEDPGATGADEVLDATAKAAYKARLVELESELADAEDFNDPERASRAQLERDALVGELAGAYGLGGRSRRLGDLGERARSTVTARIRDALRRIERVHPELAAHLRESVRTGRSCGYRPAEPHHWRL